MTAALKKSPPRRAAKPKTRTAPSKDHLEDVIERKLAPLKKEIRELRADLDAIEDAAAVRILNNAPNEERLPATIARQLVIGGNPIKVFREHRGLTQAELARSAGTSAAYISQIERGDREPGKKLLPRLSAALGVEADDLR